MTHGSRALGAAATVAVLLTACGAPSSGTGSDGPPRVGDTIPLTRAPGGVEEPWFEAERLDGTPISIADLRGSPVLINLWATWCLPCRTETPYLQSLHVRFRDSGLRVVGVTVDGRSAVGQVEDFLAEAGVTYEILHDASMISMDLFGAVGLPATFLLDAEGVITFARIGPVEEGDETFEGAIESLVQGVSRP